MRFPKKSALIIFVLMITWVTSSLYAQDSAHLMDLSLSKANASFTYKGKPIHPGLVQQFMPWLSDPGEPTIITVDVSTKHSNQYSDRDVEVKGKNVCLKPEEDGGYFCYEWLGRLANDVHVLKVSDAGSGSGIFVTLVFVIFEQVFRINMDGKKRSCLLMTVVREFSLGDRDQRKIAVLPDKVLIGTDNNQTIVSF